LTLDRDKLAKVLGLLSSDKSGEIVSAAQAAVALIRNANTSWAEVLKQSAVADEGRTLIAELRRRAENEKLRETVMQLSAENQVLREQAAGGLAHRILDGVKQSGQALLALAVAFEGIIFRRRQSAARHCYSKSRTQRVVVHDLLVAGITLAMAVVAFLSLQHVAMLGRASVRSGTMASSEQETSEATARSGELPAKVEPRGSISGQPSTAAMAMPESITKATPSDAALSPVEDVTTPPPPLPPAIAAPGQTARAVEAASPVSSPAPAEDQAAPPGKSLTTSPPPAHSLPGQRLSAAEMAALLSRGDDFLRAGDIVSARLFYERAADGGDGRAALRLGTTFDPAFLSQTGAWGTRDNPAQASSWYRRAVGLGNLAAQEYLQNLEKQRVPEPGSPPH
jgi:hypothetical protein